MKATASHESGHPHEAALREFATHNKHLLDTSAQGIYVYACDTHKVCNAAFAKMLGYASADAWAHDSAPFAQHFVEEDSQENLVGAYQDAMENGVASTIPVVWKHKDGTSVPTTVILVPIMAAGEVIALHFVTADN